jgi:hypothetical protein
MRVRYVLAALAFSGAILNASADEASKAAKIKELFAVSHLEQLSGQIMLQSMNNVKGGMMQQMLGVRLTADQ